MRQNNTYLILRELHQWEKEEDVGVACENVISVLISDEPEPGMENLEQVDIPQEVVKKLQGGVNGCGNDQEEKGTNNQYHPT